jgi:ligand-binding sensor domain-containing protein
VTRYRVNDGLGPLCRVAGKRLTSVVTYSTIEGLVGSDLNSVLALRDGTVWVGNQEALSIIDGNGIRTIDPTHGRAGQFVATLFEDSAGRRWVGVGDTVMTYEAGRFAPIAGADRPAARPSGDGEGVRRRSPR